MLSTLLQIEQCLAAPSGRLNIPSRKKTNIVVHRRRCAHPLVMSQAHSVKNKNGVTVPGTFVFLFILYTQIKGTFTVRREKNKSPSHKRP